MDSNYLLSIITFVYLLSSLLYLMLWVFKSDPIGKMGTWVSLLGFAGHTLAIIWRWLESYQMGIGHAPFSNLYESLIFFGWTIILLYLLVEWRYRSRYLGLFSAPFAFLAMAYASFSPDMSTRIQPLLPALKSNWLIAHVVTCFLGYAAFAISAGISLLLLVRGEGKKGTSPFWQRLPSYAALDDLIYQTVVIGFILLSAGIITGSIWADSAWGTYWSWDPKEAWSLVTWLVYAAFLHYRIMKGWHGKKLAVFSVVGFLCVLFTYFGVNFLLSGLHSYGAA
jgi:cytochrome c-type biogenesis protein CcsB